MTVNARRPGRDSSAAADTELDPAAESESASTDESGRGPGSSSSRRRGPSSGRVVAFPEPTISPNTGLPPQFMPAPPPATAPSVPDEEPAVLHPADRRSFAEAARPMAAPPARIADLAIGEIDQTLFDCPACRRPLAIGARRCPGCGTRLIRTVMLRKAALFVAVGLAVGAIGGLGGGIAIGSRLAGPAAAAVVTAGQAPAPSAGSTAGTTPSEAATPTTEPVTTPGPAGGSMPSVVRGALVQALALDDRLGTAEADLRAELAAARFDASAVAATMRTISAEALFGEQLAPPVAAWSDGGDLAASLATFYETVHDTAVTALDNSVQNGPAYKAAARSMAALLAGRTALDDAIHAAADAAGVSLPAATAP